MTDPTLEGDASIGRREGYLSFTASTDPTTLQQVGDNALAEVSLASDALSVPLHHGIGNGDYEPFADYRNGDWVSVDIPGTYTLEKVRVRSLSIKAIAGGDYEVDADFNSVLENIVRLKRIVDALGGGGSASGAVGSTGGSLSRSGGASSGSTGRVGAEQGDTPGYLVDKIDVLAPTKTLIGAVGARQVRITVEEGVAYGYAELDSAILVPPARLGSRTADATKFLRGDRTWAVPAGGGGTDRLLASVLVSGSNPSTVNPDPTSSTLVPGMTLTFTPLATRPRCRASSASPRSARGGAPPTTTCVGSAGVWPRSMPPRTTYALDTASRLRRAAGRSDQPNGSRGRSRARSWPTSRISSPNGTGTSWDLWRCRSGASSSPTCRSTRRRPRSRCSSASRASATASR